MVDGVNCAIPNQNTPNGCYNIELVEKADICTMAAMTKEMTERDKVLTFESNEGCRL